MKKIIFIKIGGSLITKKDEAYVVKTKVIESIAKEIQEVYLQKSIDTTFIIGNGAGSFGHYSAKQHNIERKTALTSFEKEYGFCVVDQSVRKLNSIVVDTLLANNVPAMSYQPSSSLVMSDDKVKKHCLESLVVALEHNIIPVVYGDVVFDTKNGSCILSTEDIFSIFIDLLSHKGYQIEKVIHMTTVEGVLRSDGSLIPKISHDNIQRVLKHLYKTEGYDVTGGMKHKIMSSLDLTKQNIHTYIIHGDRYGNLTSAVNGREVIGTCIE